MGSWPSGGSAVASLSRSEFKSRWEFSVSYLLVSYEVFWKYVIFLKWRKNVIYVWMLTTFSLQNLWSMYNK
jgi:hypothetical protein